MRNRRFRVRAGTTAATDASTDAAASIHFIPLIRRARPAQTEQGQVGQHRAANGGLTAARRQRPFNSAKRQD